MADSEEREARQTDRARKVEKEKLRGTLSTWGSNHFEWGIVGYIAIDDLVGTFE